MDQKELDYHSAKICHRKSHLSTNSQKQQIIKTTCAINKPQGNKKFKELEKLTNQLEKVIDQVDNTNPNLKISVKRSLNHFKTQFFDLITQNNPIQNG